MNSLRVCHVIHNTEFGGTETMLFQVLRQLAGQHEMSVVSLMRCGEIGQQIRELGIPVHAAECARNRKPRLGRLAGVVRHIRARRPTVVQTWGYHADLCGGVAARMATQSAVIWNIRHATLNRQIDSKNVLRSATLCARLSRWVPDRILLNAEAAVDVHAQAGYDRKKMQILPNGFDLATFLPLPMERLAVRRELQIPTEAPVLGMCGRFHRHKGQADFVRMAQRVALDWPQAHFVIAGNGCDQPNVELTTWIKQVGLEHRFRLLGPRHDMPRILNAMDVYVLPSLTEGMPNVVGEAMACGIGVVATDVGDASRLVAEFGTIVPPTDVESMARAATQELRRSSAERDSVRRQARRHILENYEIGAIAEKYVSTWQEVRAQKQRAKRTFRFPSAAGTTSHRTETSKLLAALPSRPKLMHVTTIAMTPWLFLRGQIEFMDRLGFDVHVVSSPGTDMQKLRQRDPVTTHEVAISRRIQPVQDVVTAYLLYKLFRRLRPQIVQLSTPKAALLGALAAKVANVPVRIYQVRGLSSESEAGVTRRVFQQLERITASLCNGCLVNANSLLAYGRHAKILKAGYVAGRGMSNGIDLQHFNSNRVRDADLLPWGCREGELEGPVIGYVGRLTKDKGMEDLAQAWAVLRSEFPTSRLLLVGPWESESTILPTYRASLQADPRVIMTGRQDDVAPFYKAMDLFVYPSHGTEGFPNAPMEAAAMGLPVIVTRVVGCIDAVEHDRTGSIIAPRAPAELVTSVRAYLRSPLLRARHGSAGRERIRTGFAPQDLWVDFRDYYFHLLRRERLLLPTPRVPAGEPRKAA